MLQERSHPRGGLQTKMYSIFKYVGPDSLLICGGIISEGCCFCIKKDCTFASNQTKFWGSRSMEEGFYILDVVGLKAFIKPCLPMAEANCLSIGREVLGKGEKPMEIWVWAAIF